MIEQIGGRKFIYALFALFGSFALTWKGSMSAETWTVFVGIVGGTYVIGNVATKVMDGKKDI